MNFLLFQDNSGPEPTEEEKELGVNDPHNVPFIALGTGLLWFGWFGFNAGSALQANSVAAYAAINSEQSGTYDRGWVSLA